MYLCDRLTIGLASIHRSPSSRLTAPTLRVTVTGLYCYWCAKTKPTGKETHTNHKHAEHFKVKYSYQPTVQNRNSFAGRCCRNAASVWSCQRLHNHITQTLDSIPCSSKIRQLFSCNFENCASTKTYH